MKKKKTLIVLLVLLLVGILAFTAFACNKEKKPPVDDNDDDDDSTIIDDEGPDLPAALTGIVASIDNLIASVGDIKDAASVSATIFVNAATTGTDDDIDFGLEISLAASMDKETTNNNWASLIVKDTAEGKNVVGLYAEATSSGEYLYIGQPLTDSDFKWSKLSQAKEAGLIRNKLVPEIFKLIEGIDKDSVGSLVADNAGSIIDAVGLLNKLLTPYGDNEEYYVDGGYEINVNVAGIGSIMGMLGSFDLSAYMSLIDIATDIILGVKLSESSDVDFSKIDVPAIALKVATVEEGGKEIFNGLTIDYSKKLEDGDDATIDVSFGFKDVALSAKSKAAEQPFDVAPAELVLKLSLDVTLPTNTTFAATNAVLDVYVKPAVKLGFDKDGYFAIDFTDLDGYATLTYNNNTVTVAEYVSTGDYQPGFYVDLTAVAALTTSADDDDIAKKFFIPFDAQAKYDSWIESLKPATEPAAAPQNAGNEIDTIIGSVGSIIANTDNIGVIIGQIGNILGVVINDGGLLDTITALMEDAGIFTVVEEEGEEYGFTANLEALMENLLASDGLIGGMLGKDEEGATTFGLYTGTGNEKADYTLAELMATGKVYGNVNTLINSIIYDSKLDNAIANWKNSNPKDESYADDAAYETAAYNGAVETIGTYQGFLATSAAVTEGELDSLLTMVGFGIDKTDFYKDLFLGAKITMGDGFKAEIAVTTGDDTISIGLGFDIIDSYTDSNIVTAENVGEFQTTGGTDENADKLYDALKTIANAILPEGFQISLSTEA